MNNSNKKPIVLIVVLVVLFVLATLFVQFFAKDMFGRKQSAQVINSQNQAPDESERQIITALHQFSKGRHTIAGEVNVPTPCHVLNQDVSINSATSPEQINIAFSTTAKDDESLCAQVLTSTRYKIDFVALENAVITATWNGAPAQLNLVPVAAGESLENFDVFIKG
jgi:uncharacterized membrane protein YqiK